MLPQASGQGIRSSKGSARPSMQLGCTAEMVSELGPSRVEGNVLLVANIWYHRQFFNVGTYSWIILWLQTGLTLVFCCRCQISKQRPVWIPHQKLHRACILDFFEKSQNELVWHFLVFLAMLVPESIVVRLYQVLAISSITCVKLVRDYGFWFLL